MTAGGRPWIRFFVLLPTSSYFHLLLRFGKGSMRRLRGVEYSVALRPRPHLATDCADPPDGSPRRSSAAVYSIPDSSTNQLQAHVPQPTPLNCRPGERPSAVGSARAPSLAAPLAGPRALPLRP